MLFTQSSRVAAVVEVLQFKYPCLPENYNQGRRVLRHLLYCWCCFLRVAGVVAVLEVMQLNYQCLLVNYDQIKKGSRGRGS